MVIPRSPVSEDLEPLQVGTWRKEKPMMHLAPLQ